LTHSLILKADGTVLAVGTSDIGDGTTATRCSVVQVLQVDAFGTITPLNNVAHVAAGAAHSLAVKLDGTVWAWGNNFYGQLGMTGGDRLVATQVPNVSGAVAISAGSFHSIAQLGGGGYAIWGRNDYGQANVGIVTDGVNYGGGYLHSLSVRTN